MDALRLGPLVVPLGPLLLVLGYLAAVWAAGLLRQRGQGDAEPALLPLLLVALVVARVVFVARHAADYAGVLAMLDVRDRGFDPWAGWAALILGAIFWIWHRPALRRSLPASALAGAVLVLAGSGLATLLQPSRPPLPDVVLQRLDGGLTPLHSLTGGQPMVVNLWATWCPPCRRELPMLVQAAGRMKDARIVLVAEGEPAATVRDFLRAEHLDLPLVLLDPDQALMRAYQSPGFPTTLFVGADGKVRRLHVGELSAATLAQGVRELKER